MVLGTSTGISENSYKSLLGWVNSKLKKRDMKVSNLSEDFQDGLALINLLEILAEENKSGTKFPKYNKTADTPFKKGENNQHIMDFIQKEKIPLVNIGNSDLTEGNEKLTLALIFALMEHYHFGLGYREARNELLEWIKKKIPEYGITGFSGKQWNDGKALNALLDAMGEPTDHAKMSPDNAKENWDKGLDLASAQFDIPKVVDPSNPECVDPTEPDIAEQDLVMYLSHFPKAKLSPEAQKRADEAEAKRKADEEAAKKKAEEDEAARLKAEEDAKKKAEEDEAARLKAEEDAAAKKKADEEAEAKRKAAEEADKKKVVNKTWAISTTTSTDPDGKISKKSTRVTTLTHKDGTESTETDEWFDDDMANARRVTTADGASAAATIAAAKEAGIEATPAEEAFKKAAAVGAAAAAFKKGGAEADAKKEHHGTYFQGWVWKKPRGESKLTKLSVSKKWKHRFFVVTPNGAISYFENAVGASEIEDLISSEGKSKKDKSKQKSELNVITAQSVELQKQGKSEHKREGSHLLMICTTAEAKLEVQMSFDQDSERESFINGVLELNDKAVVTGS